MRDLLQQDGETALEVHLERRDHAVNQKRHELQQGQHQVWKGLKGTTCTTAKGKLL